jgi:hypothetical protein
MRNLFLGLSMLFMGALPAVAADAPVRISNDGAALIVVGTGKLEVMPDMGFVNMNVTTRAKTAKEAQAANATTTNRLVNGLVAKFNLDKAKDIRTTGYSVNPEYKDTPNGGHQLIGYAAKHSLAVRVMDLDLMGAVIDFAGTLNATTDYVQFALKNQTAAEHEALKLAMADAQGRAQAIAEANGRTVGRLVKVSEASYEVQSPRQSMDDRQEESGGGTEIHPDLITITATLTVEYEF